MRFPLDANMPRSALALLVQHLAEALDVGFADKSLPIGDSLQQRPNGLMTAPLLIRSGCRRPGGALLR
jgi:hypothetical protein